MTLFIEVSRTFGNHSLYNYLKCISSFVLAIERNQTKQSKLMITRNNDKIVKREVSRDVRKFSYKKCY